MRSIPKTLCSACGKYFASTSEFDEHRIGIYGRDRRCMTEQEMTGAGFTTEQRRVREFTNGTPRWLETAIWYRPTVRDRAKRFRMAKTAPVKSGIGIVEAEAMR